VGGFQKLSGERFFKNKFFLMICLVLFKTKIIPKKDFYFFLFAFFQRVHGGGGKNLSFLKFIL